ncbi:g9275 [Coccomyxa elongata]
MGRPFLQYVKDGSAKYICRCCSCDVASMSGLVWQGVMGAARQPAVLLRDSVNLEPASEPRSERLSSGRYTLVDMCCRGCATVLGWRYKEAKNLEEKYKEGCTLLQISLLSFVEAEKPDVDMHPASQHTVAVRC